MKKSAHRSTHPLKLSALLVAAQGLIASGNAQSAPPSTPENPAPDSKEKTSQPPKAAAAEPEIKDVAPPQGSPDKLQNLDEVVVKGSRLATPIPTKLESPKNPLPLLNTPQTIQIIPEEIISQQNAVTLSDVLRNTPGIMMAAGEGGGASSTAGDAFYMRGFDASNSIFVDGIRNTGSVSRDMFNYEQVEVVKGPSGENGRGVASGYINLSSKTPQPEAFARGNASFGFSEVDDITRRRATLDVNSGIIDNSPATGTAFRFNALVQDGGVAGRQYAEQKRVGLAPSLALGLGTDTRAFLSYQYIKEDNIPDYGVPAVIDKDLASAANYMPGVDRSNFYGLLKYDHEDVTSHNATLRLEHDFSDNIQFSNITNYTHIDRFAEITSPNSYNASTALVNRSHQINDRTTESFANLANLLIKLETGTLKHTITTGLDFSHEKSENPRWTVSGTVPGADLYNPDPWDTIVGYAIAKNGQYTNGTTDTLGLYLYDSVELTKQWILNGGARFNYYSTSYESQSATALTELDAHDTYVDWRAALTYKPVENGSIYFAAGTSTRPPGTNLALSTSGTSADNPSLDPQVAYNYELGTKWEFFEGRFAPSIALFRTENTNIAYTDPVTSTVSQQRDQIVQGVELGTTGWLTERWQVFAGFTYMDTKVTKQTTVSPTGDSMPLAPKYSGSIWTSYRFPVGVTLGLGAQYVGKTNRLQTSGTNSLSTPAYVLCNGMLAWEVTENCTIQFNVNNIFNEEYVRSYNNNGNRANLGTPRNYSVSANFQF